MKKIFSMVLLIVIMCTACNQIDVEYKYKAETNIETDQSCADQNTVVSEYNGTELSVLVANGHTIAGFEAVAELAEEKLGITINIEHRPSGEDGESVVRTRLVSGEMTDLCIYNAGALLAELDPSGFFVDLSDYDWIDCITDDFKEGVTVDDAIYGIPFNSCQVGGIIYNKELYEMYNLEIPNTWAEFIANCEILKAAGETAIICSNADSWTSQVLLLGDYYNVKSHEPDFVQKFESGELKYAENPAGLRSFQKIEDAGKFYNTNHLSTSYEDACKMIINDEGAHWIILSQVLSNIYEVYGDEVNKLGLFPIPGDDKNDTGLTVWMPSAIYVNRISDNIEVALQFLEFYLTQEAQDAYESVVLPEGAYCIKDREMSENTYEAVKDMIGYFENDQYTLAMEYETVIKGTNCSMICQQLGARQITALEAAMAYDEDCKKRASKLGLDW